MSDDAWWVRAGLYRQWPNRVQLLKEGSLAALIWIAWEAGEAEQQSLMIQIASPPATLLYDQCIALSQQPDFPICI